MKPMERHMKTILTVSLLLLATACNTLEGMGRDLEGAGEGLSNTADRVKKKL